MLRDDFDLRLTNELIETYLKIAYGIKPGCWLDAEKGLLQENTLYPKLKQMINDGNINDAEDILYEYANPINPDILKVGLFFYYDLTEEMQEYFAMLYDQTPTDRIFLVTKSFLHHEIERGCKLSGVKKIRIHDLRHSHISHLIDLGFSAVAIADRVGHESIDITYRYSHLFPSKQVAMADRLDAVNASFEDCEEQDDDADIMQAEETAPMIDMDAAVEKIISIDKYKAV